MLTQVKERVGKYAFSSEASGHNRGVDGLRFLLSAAIVYFHILHSNIISYTGEQQLYIRLQELSNEAGLIVECFLILGGYFIYHSYRNNSKRPWGEFAVGRVVRLWPTLLCYTVISVLFFGTDVYVAIMDLCFFRCTGLSLANIGIIWYIGPFFWCSLLLYALLTQVRPERHGLMLGVITYFCYVMNINCYSGGLGRSVEYGFVSMAMLRVMGGLCLGCLLEMLLYWGGVNNKNNPFSWRNWAIQSAVEIGLSVFLIGYLLLGLPQSQNRLVIVLAFFLLCGCLLQERQKGIVSLLLGNPVFAKLGRYSYSIYVMQQISFYILQRTLWKQSAFVYSHAYRCIAVSVLFSILVGVLTYHLVEQPAARWYKAERKKKKTQKPLDNPAEIR